MIKFIPEEIKESKMPTFDRVQINQFFVNDFGMLCQKRGSTSYTIVATSAGEPHSDYIEDTSPQMKIQRILPKIAKIEF